MLLLVTLLLAAPDLTIETIGEAPAIDLAQGALCFALHQGQPLATLAKDNGWSAAALDAKLARLVVEGLAKKNADGKIVPSVMIISRVQGAAIYRALDGTAADVAGVVRRHIARMKTLATALSSSKRLGFDEISLFILSDVLLADWQIAAVEKQFADSVPAEYQGKHHELAILQGELGLYTSRSTRVGHFTFGSYGDHHAINAALSVFADDPNEAWRIVAKEYLSLFSPPASLPPHHLQGLVLLGLSDRQAQPLAPVISAADATLLDAAASAIWPELGAVLELHRADLVRLYEGWKSEVSFAEFFLWVYHFVYGAATRALIADGSIEVPASGAALYWLIN